MTLQDYPDPKIVAFLLTLTDLKGLQEGIALCIHGTQGNSSLACCPISRALEWTPCGGGLGGLGPLTPTLVGLRAKLDQALLALERTGKGPTRRCPFHLISEPVRGGNYPFLSGTERRELFSSEEDSDGEEGSSPKPLKNERRKATMAKFPIPSCDPAHPPKLDESIICLVPI